MDLLGGCATPDRLRKAPLSKKKEQLSQPKQTGHQKEGG
jgi:hypothetical protein